MVAPGGESHQGMRFQQNTGPGTFIGGDNHGTIEMVDAKTKSVLDKISKEAPRLGDLLKQALRDGVISPDVAVSLSTAAHNINHDVASQLWEASRSINYDTASLLWEASRSLNVELGDRVKTAADSLAQQPQMLRDVNGELRVALDELRDLAHQVNNAANFSDSAAAILGATENLAMASNRVTPRSRTGPFLWGFFLGVVAVLIALGLHAYSQGAS